MTTSPESAVLRLHEVVLERMVAGAGLAVVLETLCRTVADAVGRGVCTAMRYDPEEGVLRVAAAPDVSPDVVRELDGLAPGTRAGSCGTAFHTKALVAVVDVLEDERWRDLRPFALHSGIRACWSAPILLGAEAVGTLAISRTVAGAPSHEHRALLEIAGRLAAIAMDRERVESELHRQRALLHSTIEATEDPVFVKDTALRYRLVNSAEARGVAEGPDAMVGRTDRDLYPEELAREHEASDRAVLETGRGRHYEQVYENPVEGRRAFLIRKSPLIDGAGRIAGVVGIARDITALKETEEALRHTQKLESLGVLAGGIAHDFNNILSSVMGNAYLALDALPEGAPARGHVVEIEHAALRAADLTAQMLAYAGRGGWTREVVSLPGVLSEVAELLSSSISKKADLRIEASDDVPDVDAAPTQLRQVVMNVLTNASEALDDRAGEIRVTMRRAVVGHGGAEALEPGAYALLEVADDGCGMDAETRARIFDPFFTTKFEGRGLGLAAVQGIVRAHDGAITVESEPGRGTTVRIVLPAAELAPTPASERAAAPARALRGRVLVVDDEPAVRAFARRVLEGAGCRVELAEDGEAALRRLEGAADVDLVLLDLTMPRLSGEEVALALAGRGRAVPIVMMSGYGPDAARALDLTAMSGFLPKPFRPDELLERVAAALAP